MSLEEPVDEPDTLADKTLDIPKASGCYTLADVLPAEGEDNSPPDAPANDDLFTVDCLSANELSLCETDCVPLISLDCEKETT